MSPLNITCPPGGTFYACADTSRFLGCCRTNPCATGCPAGNLLPTTFDPAQYGSFGDQQCDAGSFYTCIYPDNSTFVGCCTQPACGDAHECPESSLAGAFLSGNPTKAQVFLELNTTWSQESNSTDDGSTIVTVSDAMASTGSSRPSSAAGHASAHPTSIGAIVGGAVGGFAVIVVLILGLLFVHRRRRRVSSIEEKSQADFPLNPSDRDTIGTATVKSRSHFSSPECHYTPCQDTSPYSQSAYSPPQPQPCLPPGYAAEVEATPSRHISELTANSPIGLGIDGVRRHASELEGASGGQPDRTGKSDD